MRDDAGWSFGEVMSPVSGEQRAAVKYVGHLLAVAGALLTMGNSTEAPSAARDNNESEERRGEERRERGRGSDGVGRLITPTIYSLF